MEAPHVSQLTTHHTTSPPPKKKNSSASAPQLSAAAIAAATIAAAPSQQQQQQQQHAAPPPVLAKPSFRTRYHSNQPTNVHLFFDSPSSFFIGLFSSLPLSQHVQRALPYASTSNVLSKLTPWPPPHNTCATPWAPSPARWWLRRPLLMSLRSPPSLPCHPSPRSRPNPPRPLPSPRRLKPLSLPPPPPKSVFFLMLVLSCGYLRVESKKI